MKYILITLAVLVTLGGVTYAIIQQSDARPVPTASLAPSPLVSAPSPSANMPSLKQFTLATGDDYAFSLKTITVKKGDTVRITLTNSSTEMSHDFTLDEFDVQSEEIEGGQTTTVEFMADRVGEYEYYCSLWDHREKGQVGTLIVTE